MQFLGTLSIVEVAITGPFKDIVTLVVATRLSLSCNLMVFCKNFLLKGERKQLNRLLREK